MKYSQLHYRIAMAHLYGVGSVKARQLIQQVPSLEALFTMSSQRLSKETEFSQKFFEKMERQAALDIASDVLTFNKKNNIQTHFFTSPDYPSKLKHCVDAPLCLFSKGNVQTENTRLVAIVGTREATHYGEAICTDLIKSFKGRGITVVSGLAHGIDGIVHRLCLEHNVPTIAVLGHGLDRIYPSSHKVMAKRMQENGGLFTEFLPRTIPERENFPRRNRIVAGMCDATIIVESKAKGGSLITAELANDYNRDVFAFPGSIYEKCSTGCNNLIRDDKAHLIQSAGEFLAFMGWNEEQKTTPNPQKLFDNFSTTQQSILKIMTDKQMHIDVISSLSKVKMEALNQELFFLEMEGVIQSKPGNLYSL